MRMYLFLAMLAFCFPLPAQAAVFNAVSKTLSNGMQIVVVENHRAPVVTHMLWLKVGAADESEGQSGLAHYLEHLVFKATQKHPAGYYSKAIARVGGSENAMTTNDFTAFYATVASDQLPLVMELEADRMAHLLFEEKEAKPELQVVLDEYRMRVDSSPMTPFMQQMERALYPHHPYGKPIIGWLPEIEKLTAQDAEAFYHHWYRPDRMVLVVSGDVTPDAVFALAQKYYGSWQVQGTVTRARAADPSFKGDSFIRMHDARVHQRDMVEMVKMPSRRLAAGQSYALEVLVQLLAGSDAAYLNRVLVQEKQLATDIGMDYDPDSYDESSVVFSIVPKDGIAPDAVWDGLHAALRAYAAQPPDEKQLQLAKQSLQRSAALARDSVMGPCYAIGMALAGGQTLEDVESWPEKIGAVSQAEVLDVLKKLINAPKVSGLIEPPEGAALAPAGARQPLKMNGGID